MTGSILWAGHHDSTMAPKFKFLRQPNTPLVYRQGIFNWLYEQTEICLNFETFHSQDPEGHIECATAEEQCLAGVANQYRSLNHLIPPELLNLAAALQKELVKAWQELGLDISQSPFFILTALISQLPQLSHLNNDHYHQDQKMNRPKLQHTTNDQKAHRTPKVLTPTN